MNPNTKTARILAALLRGEVVTGLRAFDIAQTLTTPQIIQRLKLLGYPITTEYVPFKTDEGISSRYARYSLPPNYRQTQQNEV